MAALATKFIDGHIIVSINKHDYIIDTGSPSSFGRGGTIAINGKDFPIREVGIGGFTIGALNNISGLRADGLLGMDILQHFEIRFTRTETTFADKPFEHAATAITLPVIETVMNVPIITLSIAGATRRMFFDTGAKLSYLSDDLLAGKPVGEADDFHPSIGKYKTNIYRIDVPLHGTAETLTFGSLPSALRAMLTLARTEGILGTELLSRYSLTLSQRHRSLVLEPAY